MPSSSGSRLSGSTKGRCMCDRRRGDIFACRACVQQIRKFVCAVAVCPRLATQDPAPVPRACAPCYRRQDRQRLAEVPTTIIARFCVCVCLCPVCPAAHVTAIDRDSRGSKTADDRDSRGSIVDPAGDGSEGARVHDSSDGSKRMIRGKGGVNKRMVSRERSKGVNRERMIRERCEGVAKDW